MRAYSAYLLVLSIGEQLGFIATTSYNILSEVIYLVSNQYFPINANNELLKHGNYQHRNCRFQTFSSIPIITESIYLYWKVFGILLTLQAVHTPNQNLVTTVPAAALAPYRGEP